MEKTITLAELAEQSAGKYDTLYRKAKRMFPAEAWTKDTMLSVEQIKMISGNSAKIPRSASGRKSRIVPKKPETKPEAIQAPQKQGAEMPPARQAIKWPTLAQIRNTAISCILIGVVLCHAGLIWYDCSQLWDMAGQIGGGAVFLIVLAAVMLASDQSHYATSEAALWFIFIVDCAAWWVHMPVFKTPVVSDTITGSLCAFLCASSWMALYLFRAKNIEQ